MKECEWCGIDFRGPFKTLKEHFFCSETCIDDWRRDVYGDAVVEAENKAAAEARAQAEAEPEPDSGGNGEADSETGAEAESSADGGGA